MPRPLQQLPSPPASSLSPPPSCPQLTLLALYHLLDFGSGYESDLRRQGGRGVRDTLLYGLLGLHLGGSRLDAHKLKWVGCWRIRVMEGPRAAEAKRAAEGQVFGAVFGARF